MGKDGKEDSVQNPDKERKEYKKGLTVSHRVHTRLDLEHGIKQELPIVEFALKGILLVVPVDVPLYTSFPKEFDKVAAVLMRKVISDMAPQIVQMAAMMPKGKINRLIAGKG